MVFQTYHVLLDKGINRDHLIKTLKGQGVETNLGAQALHCLTYYRKKYGYGRDDFKNAYRAYTHGLALPMGNHVTEKIVQHISSLLHRYR
jgi:dTDP-4-amino-4,6-dideoxygalactose transaminase